MRLVKNDLGPDAVIIATRKVRRKGILGYFLPPRLEVTAARDEQPETPQEKKAGDVPKEAPSRQRFDGNPVTIPRVLSGRAYQAAPAAIPAATSKPRYYTLEEAAVVLGVSITTVRNYIKRKVLKAEKKGRHWYIDRASVEQAREQVGGGRPQPAAVTAPVAGVPTPGQAGENGSFFDRWHRRLRDMEIEAPIAEDLMAEMRARIDPAASDAENTAENFVKSRLKQMLGRAYGGQELQQCLFLVGPTGVGKTTTLAKLAARFTLFQGKKVAIATLDTFRLGAVEQLKSYAEIIGIPVEVAMGPRDLDDILQRYRHMDHILVDTAGRPFNDAEQVRELQSFLEVVDLPHDVFLVLGSNTKMRDMRRCLREFEKIQYSKLIFTKIDETEALGCVVNTVHNVGLPVMYVTNGQNVPDDIKQVGAADIVDLLFRGAENNARSSL